MCWNITGLASSLDILLAFAPDICDADMHPICSQLIKGPRASFCYLDLSMAPVGPWVSATSSICSWLGWSMHTFTGPCSLGVHCPEWCSLCSAVSLTSQSCPVSWPCTVVSAPSAKGDQSEVLFALSLLNSQDTAFSLCPAPWFCCHFSSLQSFMQSHWYVEWPSFSSSQLSSPSQV